MSRQAVSGESMYPLVPAPPLPESLVDFAANALRTELVLGRLTPGSRISPESVATRLGISHIPVREALRLLQAEGHLVRDGNRGVRVAPISADEAQDIYRTRALLEREANSLGIPRLTDADIEAMERLVDELEAAARAGDLLTYRRLNRAFHFIPFERSGRPWIVRFLNILWDAALRYQSPLYATGAWRREHAAHQRSLLQALATRDVGAANAVMRDHRRWLLSAEVEEPGTPALPPAMPPAPPGS